MPTPTVEELVARRQQILDEIADIGDLRPGSLKSRYRKCGKPNCHCAAEGDPGHGPHWTISRLIKGKMHCHAVPASAVEETRRHVEACHRFRALTLELIEVSDRICELRLAADRPAKPGKKGASKSRSLPH